MESRSDAVVTAAVNIAGTAYNNPKFAGASPQPVDQPTLKAANESFIKEAERLLGRDLVANSSGTAAHLNETARDLLLRTPYSIPLISQRTCYRCQA